MKSSVKIATVVAATALALSACGAAPDAATSGAAGGDTMASGESMASGAAAGGSVKACMVSDAGGFDDKSFNQSGKEGLEKAKAELGVEVAYSESKSDADFQPNIAAQIQEGCNLIIGVGFLMANSMNEAALANPNVKFALVDAAFADNPANSKALLFNTAEAGFLAGYAAAGTTTSGTVGTFLGKKIPSTAIFSDGFADGVAKYNEAHGTAVKLIGWDKAKQEGMSADSFEDVAKGKQLSQQLVEQGADIIMPVAGPVGGGTLTVAKETGKASVVWVDSDGYLTQPEFKQFVMTSVMKEIGASVFEAVKAVKEGTFTNEAYVGTLANGGVGIAPFHDFDAKVSAELKSEIEKLTEDIKSGKLKVESVNTPSNKG
ncbi:BMP family ABC transporter substrate-binding protein [Schaalia sp. 19OD2882]|nr:BMP family ABC transporter substrate-binding protein [Schaalia sp. 19OD2882]